MTTQPVHPAPSPLLAFDAAGVERACHEGRHDEAAERFLTVLDHLRTVTYYRLDAAHQRALDVFVESFLHAMSRPDFRLSDAHALKLVDLNATIGNAVAMSGFRTTDPWVRIILGQQGNFTRLLALANTHTSVPLDRQSLFATSPAVATRWYFNYLEGYRTGCASDTTLANLRAHIRFEDDRLVGINAFAHHGYFGATSIDHEHDYLVKQRINRLVAATPLCQRPIVSKPRPGKIAVFTAMWFPRQSVYRSQQPFLEALARDHELVLVHLGPDHADLDTRLFSEVRRYDAGRDAGDISAFAENDFALAYFPDIGMSLESILLANMRIAPIQVANYGHPVSTFGAKIDYWIGGRDTEVAERAGEHYSERLVLIPGCGQAPVPLDYQRRYPPLPEQPVIVNCPWTAQKINADHLRRLKTIGDRATTPVVYHFFPGGAVLGNGFIPLERAIHGILGADRARVFPDLPQERYLEALEGGHLAFDAHPFGGYNTAVDLLTLRQPILTLAGNRFYNLSTASLLRRVGLDELVATTEQQFLDLGVRLVDDRAFRERMIRRLKTADLAETVLSHEHVPAFVRAIDHLLARHASLAKQPGREPILID
jgi:hypothetical protein